ncbi:endopeptidase La [bacterium]|nr:endopeptidase La [bacterium]
MEEHDHIGPELLVLPIYNTVILAGMTTQIFVDREKGAQIKAQMDNTGTFLLGLTVKDEFAEGELSGNSFYRVGTLIKLDAVRPADSGYLLILKALKRIHADRITADRTRISAVYSYLDDRRDLGEPERFAMAEAMRVLIRDIGRNFKGAEPFLKRVDAMRVPDDLMGFAMPHLEVPLQEKQALLEIASERDRCLKFLDLLRLQKEEISLKIELSEKLNKKLNSSHREAILREQLKAIQDELKETQDGAAEAPDYRTRINEAMMPEAVKTVALAELEKMETFGPKHHEFGLVKNYLELLLSLPWKPGRKRRIDLDKARAVLDARHYGLGDVKDRIIQHLAVMKLKKGRRGSILLLAGPPGTGKTSLGKSIAEALKRKYVRISLGGIKDEAEIRGHRRTYVGALPGRIIQGMKQAGETNPVFVLDEVDKLMTAYSGDPASALLEVLDPEQNSTFTDHYLEVPYDLSDVFFIATANYRNAIPAPLLDRMEVIDITSYTNREKFEIAKRHLLPEVLDEHGLKRKQVTVDDEAVGDIIDKYTREAGVRGLKKQLAKIARVITEKIVSGKAKIPIEVTKESLKDVLGKETVRLEDCLKQAVPGIATGLAWTPVGGDILFIEATAMNGKGELILTGQLGDVMKESAKISLSLIRSRLGHMISSFDFAKTDLHIHVPSGAVPKDGPSAGITLFVALASLLLRRAVDTKTAMTGEITLRGSVLPVGGIKEKVLAAHRAGITRIILAKANEDDLKDLPAEITDRLEWITVETIEEVVKAALDIELPVPEMLVLRPEEETVPYN